ncbi:MAG: LPS export ABC transporter permease LptF [Gammaproteobacteria bacterium]|nr:LPS export ABC transporter permease LptF [Gammaproteobacteria bacterium]
MLAPTLSFLYNAKFTGKNWFVIFVIISRYLIKEVFSALLAVTLVLLLIFLSNQLVRYLSYAASGKIAANIVLTLMGFEIPYLLALLLPLGLYLGIILAYGRLYADSEMPVLNACGLGLKRLLAITSVVTLIVAAAVAMLTLWINPIIAAQKVKGLSQDNLIDTLQPGRFQVIHDGRWVVYVEQISRDRKQANNLFIAEEKPLTNDTQAWTVVSAAQGFQEKDPTTKQSFIAARNGYRYDGAPGQNAYKIVQFQKYAVRVPTTTINTTHQEQEAIPTLKLLDDYDDSASAAELQWRLSMPISALILMLLAVPLSRVRPRQGRYSHLLPAMLIYIIYVNLLFVARNWVEQDTSAGSLLGMWWVHALLFAFAILLLVVHASYHGWSFQWLKAARRRA